MQGLNLAFRPGATKVEILVGDARGHDPDPATGYTAADVIARAQAQSIAIYGLDGRDAADTFSLLTDPTGGKLVSTEESEQVPAAIAQAISAQATAPSANAGGVIALARHRAAGPRAARTAQAVPYSAPLGVPLPLTAGASWSPLGRALSYHWDLDSDGVSDIDTDVPVITHTWTTPFDGDITLTVTDSAGQSAVTRVHVSVAGAAIAAPGRPGKPHVTRWRSGARITWRAGHGGAASAYVLRSAQGAVISYVQPRKGSSQATVIAHLAKRAGFRVRVSALNAAGESRPSAASNPLRVARHRRSK